MMTRTVCVAYFMCYFLRHFMRLIKSNDDILLLECLEALLQCIIGADVEVDGIYDGLYGCFMRSRSACSEVWNDANPYRPEEDRATTILNGYGELAEPMGVRFYANTDFTLDHFARCFRPASQPLRMCRSCWIKFERSLETVTSKATLYKLRIGGRRLKSALHPADKNTVLCLVASVLCVVSVVTLWCLTILNRCVYSLCRSVENVYKSIGEDFVPHGLWSCALAAHRWSSACDDHQVCPLSSIASTFHVSLLARSLAAAHKNRKNRPSELRNCARVICGSNTVLFNAVCNRLAELISIEVSFVLSILLNLHYLDMHIVLFCLIHIFEWGVSTAGSFIL